MLLVVALAGLWVVPGARDALRLRATGADPVALSDIRLDGGLTAGRVAGEIDTALGSGDPDLADSLVALADRRSIPVDDTRRKRVAAAMDVYPIDDALTFGRGAIMGEAEGATGLAGAFAGDLVGIGDVRDLAREGWNYATGAPADPVIMGLAAIGLAVTAATWASVGQAAPLRGGLTLIKALRRGGRVSAGLARSLGRMVGEAVDLPGLKGAIRSAGALDLASARAAMVAAVRPARLAPLATMTRDAVTIARRSGTRALDDAFALARSPAEVGRAARLSGGFGRATRGALKVLGRSALLIGEAVLAIGSWILAGCAWLVAIALAAARLGRWLGGLPARRRKRPPTRHPPSGPQMPPAIRGRGFQTIAPATQARALPSNGREPPISAEVTL